jgi:hypothetical protein
MTAVVNWLSSFRLYLDHEERRIKNPYGDGSEQLARFETATSYVFEHSAAYRVSYKFRGLTAKGRRESAAASEVGGEAEIADLGVSRDRRTQLDKSCRPT